MNEREFYRIILGLVEPWEVQEVKVDAGGLKVEVRVGYRDGTLKEHLHGLLSYFHHRITNAVTEAFNAIQSLKAAARGFRNFDHYRTRILFFLGRLNLHPL